MTGSEKEAPPSGNGASEEKDGWSRALDSLALEFQSPGEPRRPPRGGKAPPPTPTTSGGGSGSEAFVSTQELQEEIVRLREELALQEEAFRSYENLVETGGGEAPPPPPPRLEDPAIRKKIQELEATVSAAELQGMAHEMVVEKLQKQLDEAQLEIQRAREALASRLPSMEGSPPAPDRAPSPAPLEKAPAAEAPPAAGGNMPSKVIVRPGVKAGGEGGTPPQAAKVEIYGPNETLLGSVMFAMGEGQALELFLSTLVIQWKALGHPFDTRIAPDGVHITVLGDSENRRLSILTSGAYVIHLGLLGAERVKTMIAALSSGVMKEEK